MGIEYNDLGQTRAFAQKNTLSVVIYESETGGFSVCFFRTKNHYFFLSKQRREKTTKVRFFKTLDAAYNIIKTIPGINEIKIKEVGSKQT